MQRTKERKLFYRGEGGVERGCSKQSVRWRKLGVRSVVAFHWLNCDGLSLAGLLLGENLPSSCWVESSNLPTGSAIEAAW